MEKTHDIVDDNCEIICETTLKHSRFKGYYILSIIFCKGKVANPNSSKNLLCS
jgi:hypothetical protein